MANRYDIIHIDFQASARGANAAIESIRQEADKCNTRISELKKNIAEAPKDTDAKILEGWNQELKVADRRFRQLTQAQKELMKGMRALDEGVKMFNDGSLSAMNAAFQKQVNNAAKLAQSKLTTGTKEWRDMGALMQETEQNYARMMRDTDQLIESLQNGGAVFRKTLEDEKKGLQDLLQVLPYMGTEYRKAEEQLQFLVKTTDELAIKERQLKGEIVTTDDARRVSLQLTKEGAEAARQRAAAADMEIEKGKQNIETLEKEREEREKNARASAQAAAEYRENQQMYEDEIDRLQREIKAEEERAASGRTGVEAMRRKAEAAGKAADKEIEAQKKLDAEYETAKGKFMALREEYEKMKQAGAGAPVKDVAASAEKSIAEETTEASKKKTEAKKEETAATKETTAAKKEEVKAGEEAADANKKEAETAETLEKKHKGLVEETRELIAERETLTKERDGLVKTLEAEAAAAEKAANAFASLSKEEAEAKLKEKQMASTISKGADNKFAYSNPEEAQYFLIESMRQANPANAKSNTLSLNKEGVAKVKGMFMERYGIQDDTDAIHAMRGLLSGNHGKLLDMGMINDAFSRVDLNPAKVSAYAKEIKDLTAVVNDKVKAVEGESEAKKRLEQVDTRLLEIDEKIDANDKASREIHKQRRTMIGSEANATEELTEKTNELSEARKKDAEASNAQIEAIKKMSAEEAMAAKAAMTKKSTVDYKSNKLDMSNPEEVQSWLITQMLKHGASAGTDGTLSVGGANVNTLLAGFKDRYGMKGDNQKAKQLFKDVIQGKGGGGLLKEGGVIDFSADTLMVKANVEAYQGRIDKLKALFEITNKASYAAAHSTETTERGTQAVKDATEATKNQTAAEQKALEVKRLKEAYDKSQAEYEKMKEHLAGLKKKKSGLPGGMDAALERESLTTEINDYDENVKKPKGREVTKLKNQWQKAAQQLAQMQTEETAAENQNTEATERNVKAKRGKARASEDSAKATKEETQQSAELLAKEKEMKEAEAEMIAVKERDEAQQKKTNKAVEDAETANEKAKQSEADLVKSLDEKGQKLKENKEGLENLNKANKDTIATNEKNQQLLAETNGKIQEQGEKIRDAERIKAQAKTDGIEKTEQAIRLLQEENRHIDQNSFTWKRNTIEIQHLQEALDEMKGKPALMMMEQRMKNIGALSASALEETRRFWDTMAAGAEKGSEKLATAEANVKALVEEEQKRSDAQAGKVIGNMGSYSDKEIADAVKTFEQLRDAQTHGNDEWRKFNELAEQGKQHLEELAKQDALAKMEERMSNLTNLSDAALAETKKYWEALKAGAEKGSEDLTKAETNLTRIIDLEKERTRIENERKAQIVSSGGSLNMYSEAEISEAIKAAKELHSHMASADPEARKLADSIANAEAHIKQYGIEAARAAQRQEELDATMQKQFQTMMNGMRSGVMPSQAAVKSQMNYWQKLIDDPKTAAESLQFYRDQLAEVKKMYDFMIKSQGESALAWFQQGSDKDASGNQIKEMADKLKEYRGTLLQETNAAEIQQIDDILQRIGASAKKASEELMDFEKAKELALQAGSDVYGQKNPSFLASPEEIQAATKSIEKYREELFKTIKQKKDMGEATDDEEAELQELAKYLKDLKFEQDNFNMSREKMEALMNTPVNATSIDELRAAIKRADAELKRMEGSLGQNNDQYKAFADQVKNAKNMLKEMEGQAKASATAWEKAWSRLKTYVVMYMGFNAVWQKVVGTADDLMDLSDKMGEVRKTTGFTADEVGRLSDELKKLDTRTTITGLLDLSVAAGQLGLKTQEDVEGFTIAANKLMVALPEMGKEGATEMLKVALATGEIDKIRKQMEQGIIDGSSATAVAMEKVGSTIDRLRATSAATAPAITDFVKRVGAVGAQSGISIDQVAALGSTVDALGMRVEMSATALSRMIPAIKNNAFAVAKAIGVTPETLRSLFEAGKGMEAILLIFQHIKDAGMGEDDIEKMLGMGGMKEVMKELNQQGARAGIVFAGLSQNVDVLRQHLGTAAQAYEENIAIQQEYDKMNETTAAKWERLKNEFEEFFVGDYSQRVLGGIIDTLRLLVNFLTGNVNPALQLVTISLRTFLVYWATLKVGLGEALFVKATSGLSAMGAQLKNLISDTRKYIKYTILLGRAEGEQAKAAVAARMAQEGLNKAMIANVWMAVIMAIGAAALALYNWVKEVHAAAKEAAKFQNELMKEQMKVDNLTESIGKAKAKTEDANKEVEKSKKNLDAVKKSTDGTKESTDKLTKAESDLIEKEEIRNKAMSEHKRLIEQFNSEYGKYLGFMLSEVSSNIELANARQLVNDKLRETITLKRKEAAISRVEENMGEDRDDAYASLWGAVRYSATSKNDNGKSIQDPTKAAKVMNALTKAAMDASNDRKSFENAVKRILQENKVAYRGNSVLSDALSYYDEVAKIRKKTVEIEQQFTAEESANREQSQKDLKQQYSAATKNYDDLQKKYETATGKAKQQAAANLLRQQDTINEMVNNAGTYFDTADANEKAGYDKFIKNSEERMTAMSESRGKLLKEAGSAYTSRKTVGGGTTSSIKDNPWGNALPAESTDWKNMTAEQLVNRRKQMKDFVNAIQTDSDVKRVLGEDAALKKAIENGMSADMRTVIEWYNTERLKIQDELHARHLTNTGDWMDPKKQKNAHKQFQNEVKAYLEELDAYYTERNQEIQTAHNNEEITEAEAWRRTINNETEWYNRRAELQKLYAEKGAEVTKEEQDAIFAIIAERTGDSSTFIQQMIGKTIQFAKQIEKTGEKGAAVVHKWRADLGLGYEKDFLKSANSIGKQMKFIEDTLAKERPYDGITKNLQENLDKMGILAAQYKRINDELVKQGKEPKYSNQEITAQTYKEMAFYLRQAEDAWSISIDELLRRMAEDGMETTAKEISKSELLKQAVMGQLRKTFEEVQNAVKKEASQIKKDVDILWNDDTRGPGGMSMKAAYDKAIAGLGMQQDSVSRANSLIGAGAASDNVAARLAMKQIEMQMWMQKALFDMYRVQANQKIVDLKKEAAEHKHIADLAEKAGRAEEAAKERLQATIALRDAENVRKSLGLTLAEETKKEEESIANLLKLQEESQNRLYTSLREWATLLSSSVQSVFEATNAGEKDYYNERAKLNLTGKGGPGAGTYIVIENEGTSDATAHYEHLDERQALERQLQIEQQNAQADAWKKVMDDFNQKLNDTITDQMNAMLQNQAIDANTSALNIETAATNRLTEATGKLTETIGNGLNVNVSTPPGGGGSGLSPFLNASQNAGGAAGSGTQSGSGSAGGTVVSEKLFLVKVDDKEAFDELVKMENIRIEDKNVSVVADTEEAAEALRQMGAAEVADKSFVVHINADDVLNKLAEIDGYTLKTKRFLVVAETDDAGQMLGGMDSVKLAESTHLFTDASSSSAAEVIPTGTDYAADKYSGYPTGVDQANTDATIQNTEAMSQLTQAMLDKMAATSGNGSYDLGADKESVYGDGGGKVSLEAMQQIADSDAVTEARMDNKKKETKNAQENDKKQQQSSSSMFAKMTAAANLYGTAYQAMSNDNLDTAQKFQMIALQAVGNAAIAGLQVALSSGTAETAASMPAAAAKSTAQAGPIAGPILFAILSALVGGLMGLAASKVAKSKSQISQVTGASVNAGRLSTGMLTYAEGNVNEFTDPDTLTPGRHYNVDAADGRTYRAKYTGKNPRTHITSGPEFHLAGEKGQEAIIDAHTTRLIRMNDTGIWQSIQALYNGGGLRSLSHMRRGRGVRVFADGNLDDFEEVGSTMGDGSVGGISTDMLTGLQASMDRNSDVMEHLAKNGIKAYFDVYGKGGLIDSYDTGKKNVQSHGERY